MQDVPVGEIVAPLVLSRSVETSDPRAESVADHFGVILVIAHGPRLDRLPQVGIEAHRDDLAGAVSGGTSTPLA